MQKQKLLYFARTHLLRSSILSWQACLRSAARARARRQEFDLVDDVFKVFVYFKNISCF